MKNRQYKIQKYDSQYPIRFSMESQKIQSIIGKNIIETHHIGSTSVEGMYGKNTIDILFVVDDILKIDDFVVDLNRIGYKSLGAVHINNTHLFEKEVNEERLFILQFLSKEMKNEIQEMFAIKNYLITHKEEILKYNSLKKTLFQKFPNDYKKYRESKDNYMKNLKERALYWYIKK